jgi:hypothetical protein
MESRVSVCASRWQGATKLLMRIGGLPAAEASFRKAIDVARCPKGNLERCCHELRPLKARPGQTQRTRDLLDPVYGWFTEGFDAPGLKDAKALLEELA